MREISWIGKCELDAEGSSLGRCKNAGLTSAYSSYHRAGRGGEGGRREGGREGGKKGGEERFKEVENNRLRFAPCVFALVHLIILLVIIMFEWYRCLDVK